MPDDSRRGAPPHAPPADSLVSPRKLGAPRAFDPVAVPPLVEQKGEAFVRLVELMQRLLAPDGCPWDREQTLEKLRPYVVEEACEVVDAIDSGDRRELRSELGDLLLQVVFQAELARAEGAFGPDDVVAAICEKLVRRHPHVFGDVEVDGADGGGRGPVGEGGAQPLSTQEVLRNWERIKADERKGQKDPSVLGSVAKNLPALMRAQRVGEKVARFGFDWPDVAGSRSKVTEEIDELDRAIASGDAAKIEEELGDALFALVNLARHVKVDAEGALRGTIGKFITRFRHVEKRVDEEHGGFAKSPQLPLEILDGYWDEAKKG